MSKFFPVRAALVALLCVGSVVPPATAQMQSLAEMQSDLQTAICLQQWHEAIQLTSTMADLEETPSRERNRLLRLRDQLEGYVRADVHFVSMPGCSVGVATTESVIPADRWQAAAESVDHLSPYWSGWVINRGLYDYERRAALGGSGGGNGGGNCSTPGDRASDGSRCGRRSASDRPGGR